MADPHLIVDAIDPVILLLTLGIVAAILSRQLGLSPIVGYLLLGLGLSRISHQILGDGNNVRTLAELGVVFLLFDIGLHFSFARMREQAANIFGFGPLQVFLGALGMGGLVGAPPIAHCTFLISPSRPEWHNATASKNWFGNFPFSADISLRCCVPTWNTRPVSLSTLRICFPSSIVSVSGFSQ